MAAHSFNWRENATMEHDKFNAYTNDFDADEDKDIAQRGPAILLYFFIQKSLIRIFIVLAVLSAPMIFIYSAFGGIDNSSDISTISTTSFGNMGFPEAICAREALTKT